ncbi:MAG: efflux RND transporter periplasmic adaptor subunit [Blastomonas sp.]|uniref:efflux RND transporter periplasmic adaptor subunit n=1 Tax=unclassified Blastomonas TaxID=2626550 RepID=UPI00082EC62E|nr:efflux RND transporter periplasmic adaptor subunit [Blastomonas sp.]MCH2236293.1 efflux RND transporter periplasmic adaptor subunit [Blastomonas sp.]
MDRAKILYATLAALAIVAAFAGYRLLGGWGQPDGAGQETADMSVAAGALSAQQLRRLGVQTVVAEAAMDVPLGTVPAAITLPPEAQVAVTAPFDGAIIRLHVIQGQQVSAGQALATVRSREPLQYGAELARAQARLGLAEASAARTRQLVQEGIVAGARADEMNAAIRVARTDVAENARILRQAGASASGEVTLRAPIAGRVAAMTAQVGGPVMATSAPFVIENSSAFTLDMQLPERLAGQVRPGMRIAVPATGAMPELTGSILSVGSSLDPATRSIIAKARIDGTPPLVAGKSVMVVIHHDSAQPGVSVPSRAMTTIDGKPHVLLRTSKGFAPRAVTVAGQSGDRTILSDGLKPGDKVAVSGISELKMLLAGN